MASDTNRSPRLVVIEGADATGKTTQVRMVAEALARADVGTWSFHHAAPPPAKDDRSMWERALAFAMQRAQFASALARGAYDGADVVLCDRWWHSTHVEAIRVMDNAAGALAHAEAAALPWPALVIILDAPDRVLNLRMIARRERPMLADEQRRSIYREAAGPAAMWTMDLPTRPKPPPLVVIDTQGPAAETARRIAVEVLRALGRPVVGWDADGSEVPCVG